MIIPVWKKLGESTHLLAQQIGQFVAQKTQNLEDQKATHTGTLDPMAEGVVVVLTGEDRFNKTEFSNNLKEYQFSIVFGVSTDSHDVLGLQTKVISHQKEFEKLAEKLTTIIPSFIGPQIQQQPAFSAQRISGKSAFDIAKTQQQQMALQKNEITIHSLKIIDEKTISTSELLHQITEKIKLVSGNFRQTEITKHWVKTCQLLEKNGTTNLPLITFEAHVTKRTYIRAIVRDISQKIGIPATTFHIIRTKNGEFSKKNCQNLM